MGGTAGGTQLTITGEKFGNNADDVIVTIYGMACDIQTISDTEIVCETGEFDRSNPQVPVEPVVTVAGGPGTAISDGTAETQESFLFKLNIETSIQKSV